MLLQKVSQRSDSGVKGECRGGSKETTHLPALPSVPSLGAGPVSTVNLYGSTGQLTPLIDYTPPEGPHNLYGNRAGEQGCWWRGNVEKEETREGENWWMWHGKCAAGAERTGNDEKTRNQMEVQKDKKRPQTKLWLHLPPHTPQCRRCHPRRCLSTRLLPPLPGRSL